MIQFLLGVWLLGFDDTGLGLKHGFLVGRFESNNGDRVGFNLIGGLAVACDVDDVEGQQQADGGRRTEDGAGEG